MAVQSNTMIGDSRDDSSNGSPWPRALSGSSFAKDATRGICCCRLANLAQYFQHGPVSYQEWKIVEQADWEPATLFPVGRLTASQESAPDDPQEGIDGPPA